MEILFSSKFVAIAACLVFIGALTTYYYVAESGFNPIPQQSSLSGATICSPQSQECPAYGVTNATLRILNRTDIRSQQITFTITAKAATPMALIKVYIDNVSLGSVEGPFSPATPKLVSLGVPTTIPVNAGQTYRLVIEGVYSQSGGGSLTDSWQGIDVLATGG